jgi:molecular chaperone GrpE (heat shock protein)
MARGWESKDVENQIEDWAGDHARATRTISPQELQLRDLQLTRTRLQREMAESENARLREQKQLALHHVEKQIAALLPLPQKPA